MILESDLKTLQDMMDEFEAAVIDLQEAGNDKDDTLFHTKM